MNTELERQFISAMKVGVNSVINGNKKQFKHKFIPPAIIKDYLTKLDWECGELETNGWQYDWWLTFTKEEKSYTAFGSGYYGTFEFSKTED